MRYLGSFLFSILLLNGYAQENKLLFPIANNWHITESDYDFFSSNKKFGETALNYWIKSYNWRSNPKNLLEKRSKLELLSSGDSKQIEFANNAIQKECEILISNVALWKSKNSQSRIPTVWIELFLRAGNVLNDKTKKDILLALKLLDLISEDAGYTKWIKTNGANGANVHGYLTPLILYPSITKDTNVLKFGEEGVMNELEKMNTSGDQTEYNLLESHWCGTSSWELIKKFAPNDRLKRVARLISERLWINRFLTWCPSVERITGPGSRMAPLEWFGSDNERALLATGMNRPIWLNNFFNWGGWDSKSYRQTYETLPTELALPDLPAYVKDLAWVKKQPNTLEAGFNFRSGEPFPLLPEAKGMSRAVLAQYTNYQANDYAIGSSTSSWVSNISNVPFCAWWNNSFSAKSPKGSPERISVLYSHYVFNGMAPFDKGEIYLNDNPKQLLKDDKMGPGGPWLREFADYGRAGTLQNKNTVIISYSPRPGTPFKNRRLVQDKVYRASAAMFLFRWQDDLSGLYINNNQVKSLPIKLKDGDWWFIRDGNVYSAVKPLHKTILRGSGATVLERRKHHIVLYNDNVSDSDITGISDEKWVKAQTGFIVKMGSKAKDGSFDNFRRIILRSEVYDKPANGFLREIKYKDAGQEMSLSWNCYTEQYCRQKVNGREKKLERLLKSPEFVVDTNGHLNTINASLSSTSRQPFWLLSSGNTYVAYQPVAETVPPVTFKTPSCVVNCDSFPFGKIIVNDEGERTKINIDADLSLINSTINVLLKRGKNLSVFVNGKSVKALKKTPNFYVFKSE